MRRSAMGWMAWAAIAIGVIIALPVFAASPSQVQEQIAEAVADQQQAGREMAAWEAERNGMLREIERLNIKIKYLDHQKGQYGAYTERRRAEIERLERRVEAVGAMNLELAPFLSEVADRLARFIEGDMAFLTRERQQRMEGVRDALTDYRLNLDEKLRRVLEALTVEVQYGHSVDTGEAAIVIDGTPRRVETLRLGRVAQYYRSADGLAVGMRAPSDPDWRPLPPGDARIDFGTRPAVFLETCVADSCFTGCRGCLLSGCGQCHIRAGLKKIGVRCCAFRGGEPVINEKEFERMLTNAVRILAEHAPGIEAMILDPVHCTPDRCIVLDARIKLCLPFPTNN